MTIKELLKQKHEEYLTHLRKKLYPIQFITRFDEELFGYVSKSNMYDIEAITDQDEDGNIESWTR